MADRDRQRREHADAVNRREGVVFQQILRIFTQFMATAGNAVLAAFRVFRIQPDPQALWAAQPAWNRGVTGLVEVELEDAAREGWELTTELPYVSTNTFVQSQLAMSRNLLVRIPDEVYHLVFAELTDGINEGENIQELANRVNAVLSMTHSQRWPNRARTIAQTETLRAFNTGAFAAAISQSQQLGIPLRKEWLATEDARTRPSHRRADGQGRLLAEPFLVGGVPLLYPGDPMAPPEEVINCRCTLVVAEEDDGR